MDLEQQLAAIKVEALELTNGLKESQFNWRPDPKSWSMAECLLHLNTIGDRYVGVLEKTIAEARAEGRTGQRPLKHGWLGKWVLANTEPPPKRRFKTQRGFTPAYGQPLTAVIPTFLHLQDQLTLQLQQANGLDWARVKAPMPGMGPLKFDLYLIFAWIAAHERRHLWQARQVRYHEHFPATMP